MKEKGKTHRQPKPRRGDMEPKIWDERENEVGVPVISQNSTIVRGYETVYTTRENQDHSKVHEGEFSQPP